MKRIIFIVSIALFSFSVFSQQKTNLAEIQWGQQFKIGKRFVFFDIITIDEQNNIHVLYKQYSGFMGLNAKFHVAKISSDLKYSPYKELNLEVEGNPNQLMDIVEIGGNVYVFSSFENTKTKETKMYLHHYNVKTQTVSDGREIAKLSWEGFKRRHSGSFHITYSYDRNSVLVYYDLPYEEGKNEKFGAIIFNNQMEILWRNEFVLPYNDEMFHIEDVYLGDNAEIFIIGKKFLETDSRKKRDPRYYNYVLLSTSDQGNDLTQHDIMLKDYYISQLTAAMNPNNDIICSGFITEKQKSSSIAGVFYILIDDKTKEIEIETVKPFDFDFIIQDMSEKQQKKTQKKAEKGKDIELPYFEFRDIVVKENGGAMITAEKFYIKVVTRTDPRTGATSTTTYYYYQDIIVIDFNPEGELNYAIKIPKRQYSTDDGGFWSSYVMGVHEDKVHFIYNDNTLNINKKSGPQASVQTRGKKNISAVLVTIFPDGEWNKELLYNYKEAGYNLAPKYSMQLSANEVLLYCNSKGVNKFGIVEFK